MACIPHTQIEQISPWKGGGGGDLGQINNFLFESKVTNSQIMHVGPLSNIVLEIMVPDTHFMKNFQHFVKRLC